jgi:hypothetical protein
MVETGFWAKHDKHTLSGEMDQTAASRLGGTSPVMNDERYIFPKMCLALRDPGVIFPLLINR